MLFLKHFYCSKIRITKFDIFTISAVQFSGINYRNVPLKGGIHSAKCLIRWLCSCENMYLHKPRRNSLLRSWAVWCRLLLLGYEPVQRVTIQINHRIVNEAQEKMMQQGDVMNTMQSKGTIDMSCTGHCWNDTTYCCTAGGLFK